jgi:hypothetical protein
MLLLVWVANQPACNTFRPQREEFVKSKRNVPADVSTEMIMKAENLLSPDEIRIQQLKPESIRMTIILKPQLYIKKYGI